MRTMYIECNMGAAGDMLMGALYELLPEKSQFLQKMNALHPAVEVGFEPAMSCGIAGTHAHVTVNGEEEHSHDHHDCGSHEHDHHVHGNGEEHHHHHDHEHHNDHHGHDHEHAHNHEHHHATLNDITSIIDNFDLPQQVREKAKAVYSLLAGAESRAHGVEVGEVHFHEVGALDAVTDITGVCYAMHLLGVEKVTVSPVNLGSGNVRTAHGILPVPAPATTALVEGMPAYMSEVRGELCTPTGAALLKSFATGYGVMPLCTITATGYGLGTKQFDRASFVRAFICEEAS